MKSEYQHLTQRRDIRSFCRQMQVRWNGRRIRFFENGVLTAEGVVLFNKSGWCTLVCVDGKEMDIDMDFLGKAPVPAPGDGVTDWAHTR